MGWEQALEEAYAGHKVTGPLPLPWQDWTGWKTGAKELTGNDLGPLEVLIGMDVAG